MKKIFCIILLLFMCLLTLAACNNDNTADDIDSQYNQNINNSSDIDKLVDENEQEEQMPNQDLIIIWSDVNDAEIIDISWNGDNSTTIDDIYGIIEEDIEQVYYASNQFWRESYFLFERQEQNTWLIYNLSRLELLEKAENYDKNTAKIYLTYVIQLKNAAPIILYFYDDVVDFGQGYYFYADTEKSAIPEKISTISISLPEFYTSIDYVDTDDINILRSLLNPFVSVDVHESSLYDTSELMSIFISDEWIDYISLYIKKENGTY